MMNLSHPVTRSAGRSETVKLSLAKGFWMMKLLNRDYGVPTRAVSAVMGFGFTLLATGRVALAREMAGRFWTRKDFKAGVRLAAWYARRGWMSFDVAEDEVFDPTDGMSDADLNVLAAFVAGRASQDQAGDMAVIEARRLNNNTVAGDRTANIARFKAACDHLLAQPIDTTGPHARPDPARTGDFPIENAKTTLADFAALFPLEDLRWFVISGTFLGLIRENGFLAHDYDIDLGVFEDAIDIQATIAKVEASDTFVLKKYDHHTSTLFKPETPSTNPDIPYILKLVHQTGIHIDLFIHYHDTSTDPAIDWHGSSLHRWDNTTFDLVSYPFYDMTVLGPADADRYLAENYGDWRTPVTEFNCTTDTPNLALVPHPVAIVTFLKRYVQARGPDPKLAGRLEQELLHNGVLQREDDGTLSFSGALFAE